MKTVQDILEMLQEGSPAKRLISPSELAIVESEYTVDSLQALYGCIKDFSRDCKITVGFSCKRNKDGELLYKCAASNFKSAIIDDYAIWNSGTFSEIISELENSGYTPEWFYNECPHLISGDDVPEFSIRFENGHHENLRASSLLSAKMQATKLLSYGCGNIIIYQNDVEICRREFWSKLNSFGWKAWEDI